MNLAIYSGTFDPIHRGHLEAARAAADEFDLDRVLFIPTGRPPHRRTAPLAAYEHRYQMVELACRVDPRFEPSRLEASDDDRERHYSVDTVQMVKEGLKPNDRLFFVMGGDAFAEISLWHRWREMVAQTEFIVVSRPGERLEEADVPSGARVQWLTTVHVPISSTQIREWLAAGRSADEWLAPEVASYIRKRDLYQRAPQKTRKPNCAQA